MMNLSRFGQRYTGHSGIVELMEDLGSALRKNPSMLMMGGGTPARIPAVESMFREHLQAIINDPELSYAMLGRYQGPQGDEQVRSLLAAMLQTEYGWPVTAANIVVTNGGQSAFSILANMLAGEGGKGERRKLHFPLTPEYLGYSDIGLTEDFFSSSKPEIELLGDNFFKYRVDFAHLKISPDVAALCVSRPTNPSGNVLTDAEVRQLDALARNHNIPLILDAAYGSPFPGIQFTDATPYWSENVILLCGLSKLGLPGTRSGFMICSEEFAAAFSRVNTILNLASGNTGVTLATRMLQCGDLLNISRNILQPWYKEKKDLAVDCLRAALGNVAYHIHKPEGAFFLWLWLPGLPVSCVELYERLKIAGVLVIPGHTSFPGLQEEWQHTQECIRISYAVDASTIKSGAALLGRVVNEIYARV
ncbi:MAG: valine--pyruvate transaminase [Pseudomonadota bacterium]